MRQRDLWAWGCVLVLVWASAARADVKVPACIGDNMVLQREIPVKLWGTADPGEQVKVSFAGKTTQATADEKGNWLVKLDAMSASANPAELTIAGKNTLSFKNVLVGEVWLCSGQSNMEWTMQSSGYKDEIASADNSTIRLLNVSPLKVMTEQPQTDLPRRGDKGPQWQPVNSESLKNFSAVGYWFGLELQRKLGVPVGLINAAWGGSAVERWIPWERYQNDPELASLQQRIGEEEARFPAENNAFPQQMEKWQATTQAIVTTRPALATQPRQLPRSPQKPLPIKQRYGGMFNGNIAPMTNLAIRGVIWYQGESNAGNAMEYRKSFPAMIRAWRDIFDQPQMPFLFVQLANYMTRTPEPQEKSTWAMLRESQTMTLAKEPNTAMAVIIDVGEANNIHPKDKQTPAHRLVVGALNIVYGQKDVIYQGPTFESMKIEGDTIRVKFAHTAGGLVAKGEKLEGFAVAGADGKYQWAEAKIDGDSVIVRSEKVEKPVSVRYAWGNNPAATLYNKADLPAVPFRAGESEAGK